MLYLNRCSAAYLCQDYNEYVNVSHALQNSEHMNVRQPYNNMVSTPM